MLGVGRQVPYKGFEYLVAAMRRVDGTLLLLGDGPELLELADNVVDVGQIQEDDVD